MSNRVEEFFRRNERGIAIGVLAAISAFYLYLIALRTLEGGTVFNKTAIIFGTLIVVNPIVYRPAKIFVLSQLYLVIALAVLEVLFMLNPAIFPARFSDLSSKVQASEQARMVEFMTEAPYAKFRPDTMIRNQGARGSDFVYEWRSDRLGFKNDPSVYDKPVRAIAIGDLFTECMGCSIADAWPSLLFSRYGINTLNLGVQGYAPQQLVGSLKIYGIQMKPDYIIYGYCGTNFYRTAFFDHKDERHGSISLKEISPLFSVEVRRKNVDSFTSTLLRLAFMSFESMVFGNKALSVETNEMNEKLTIYAKQIRQDMLQSDDMGFRPDMRQWRLTVDSIREAKALADSIGARLILMHLPHRAYIYYRYLTGHDMPDSYIERQEIRELQKVARDLDIEFVRIDEPLFRYMDGLMRAGYDYGDLPYFYKDGHMSPAGAAVVAGAVVDHIEGIE